MKKENKAMLQMLTCAALWSIGGLFIKLLPWNAFAIAGMRAFFAGLTLLIYIAAKKYKIIVNKRTVSAGLCLGTLCCLFSLANKLTTAANAIVLQFTAPLFIVLFSALFFRSRIKRNDLIAVLCTMVGIALFFFDQLDGGKLVGNCVAILAGAVMAGMYMCMGEAKGAERFSAILIGQIVSMLISIPFIITTKPVLDATNLLYVVILGVLQIGVPYILFAKAAEFCPPLACSLLGALEPLLNPVWVLLFYGEKPGAWALVGGVIVVATVTLWCAFGNRKEESHA